MCNFFSDLVTPLDQRSNQRLNRHCFNELTRCLCISFGFCRLPIIQGGCHKFIPAVAALMALPMWKCPDMTSTSAILSNGSGTNASENVLGLTEDEITEVWQSRMREVNKHAFLYSARAHTPLSFHLKSSEKGKQK